MSLELTTTGSKSASSIYNLADLTQIVKTRAASIGIPSALLMMEKARTKSFTTSQKKKKECRYGKECKGKNKYIVDSFQHHYNGLSLDCHCGSLESVEEKEYHAAGTLLFRQRRSF